MEAYLECCKGQKTLIFNNGINTSREVYYSFKKAGYDIRHLDNTTSKQERKDILKWFKETPNGILTSVSILTTGFDEPSVESVILNRATRSLTLYFQMIGRGSRVTAHKKSFTIVDLGNNVLRFGPWNESVDWNHIFKYPEMYLENIIISPRPCSDNTSNFLLFRSSFFQKGLLSRMLYSFFERSFKRDSKYSKPRSNFSNKRNTNPKLVLDLNHLLSIEIALL